MKKSVVVGILFVLVFAFQINAKKEKLVLPTNESGKIVYTEIIELPNITKDVLYTRASEWFTKTFDIAKTVIQMKEMKKRKIVGNGLFLDKENGKILGKGSFRELITYTGLTTNVIGNVDFTISVYLEDGKYKYEITDFVHTGVHKQSGDAVNGGALDNEKSACGWNYLPFGGWRSIKEDTHERVLALTEILKKSMAGEALGENW